MMRTSGSSLMMVPDGLVSFILPFRHMCASISDQFNHHRFNRSGTSGAAKAATLPIPNQSPAVDEQH